MSYSGVLQARGCAGAGGCGGRGGALQREVSGNRLSDFRVAPWPAAVKESDQALQLGDQAGAALVVYGREASDQVEVQFAHPADQGTSPGGPWSLQILDSRPLPIDAGEGLPLQVRSLTLLALGQVCLGQGDRDLGYAMLSQALNALEDSLEANQQQWSVVSALLCRSYTLEQQPEQALPYCQQPVEADPRPAHDAGRGRASELFLPRERV